MNRKLLLLLALIPLFGFTQAPINQLVNDTEQDYAIIDSSTLLDESASGASVTWNFTSLSQVGMNTDTNVAPSTGEQGTYPGTTEVLVITTDGMPPTESRLFIRDVANEISITGLMQEDLELNLTNNATLGTFPLSFGHTNADTVSGTFEGSANGTNLSGTFSGTFDTEVDAHGTLNLNDFGLGAYSGNITRIKTVLDISLVVGGVFDIGTVTQTAYYYYDDTDGSLVFRTSTNEFDIDFLGNVFMETIALYEALDRTTLSTVDNSLSVNEVTLYPNPVSSVLNIKSNKLNTINTVEILDLNGRKILNIEDNIQSIDTSNLQSGLYILRLNTSNNTIIKRFVKK